jgi:hypothetical protein
MTPEESTAIYADLVALHQQWIQGLTEADQAGLRRLEAWQLETKIRVRKAFEKVARGEGVL